MDRPSNIYEHLDIACRLLEIEGEWQTAAKVSQALAAVAERFGVVVDRPLPAIEAGAARI